MRRLLVVVVLLSGCAPGHWDTVSDAIDYCMTLGEVPVKVDGEIRCTGGQFPPREER